jgi:acyl-CoA thioesterase
MSKLAALTRFDQTTALVVRPGEPGRFDIEFDPGWSSLVGIHGGYMTAIAVRAVEHQAEDRSVRTITTSFLRPGRIGPAEVVVEPLRIGRSLSTFAVTINQDHRTVLTSRITAVIAVEGLAWETPSPARLPPRDQCVPLAPPEGVPHFENAQAVLDPASEPFSHGDRARVGGYVRTLERRPIDAPWLAMILDWFPPSPFTRVDPPTGGVSIDYTVHLHHTLDALADGDWLTGAFEADISADGLALERGTIRDPEGHVLAESFHTRWTG